MRSLALLLVLAALSVPAAPTVPADPFLEFKWREIGPCTMGGRITDIAVVESKPQVYFVAAATGGVWKTVNAGTTWTPIFDKYGSASIGDIAIGPSNPDLVWVGTGEANARNSVTHGDGVYKSVDGGKSFTHMGLKETRFIGRVVIHPKDPETVYVAALGNVYVPSKHRGLYKTTDGGKTWKCIKFLDENTGVIDVALDPEKPEIIYAAAYEVRRDGFSSSATPSKFGPASGLYKSTDAGKTWKKLSAGLPTTGLGRIGIDIYRKDPNIVYAVVETGQTPDITGGGGGRPGGAFMGITTEEAEQGLTVTAVTEGGPAEKAGIQVNDVIKELGGKKVATPQELSTEIRARKPGDKIKVVVIRAGEEKTFEVTLGTRQEEHYPREVSLHQDTLNRGGVFRSEDRGETWTQMSTTNPRPFYYSQIRIDPRNDQQIYVLGTQMHLSTNGGKTFSSNGAPGIHVDHHAMWINPNDSDHLLIGNDGGLGVTYDRCKTWEHLAQLPLGQYYAVGVDMDRPYNIYGGLQDNGSWGGPSRTRDGIIANEHWKTFNGGDGFYCRIDPTNPDVVYAESQHGAAVRMDMKTGSRKMIRPRGTRFEWNTPIEMSPFDPKRIYIGGAKIHESSDRGDTWKDLSPELTKTKQGSITVIGLSPVDENVIWSGSNDGGVWVTRDRGTTWDEVKVAGLPELLWVTRLEPSRTAPGACYLTVEGRRKADLKPYVYKTADFGKTWTAIANGIPGDEPVYVIREHPRNPQLLFLGTERSVYASLSGGRKWVKLGANLPVVPVHDLAIHPRDGELVAGTHGRSLWVVDIKPLEELTPTVLLANAHLFRPAESVLWNAGKSRWFGGAKGFRGQNPPTGAIVYYYLRNEAKDVSITVSDKDGKSLGRLRTVKTAGIHQTIWNMQSGQRRVAAGDYTVTLTVDGAALTQKVSVVPDPEDATPSRENPK